MGNSVLIVEDNDHLRKILASILRFSGYQVSEAVSGNEAIDKAVLVKPGLILLDLSLPDMNGIHVARAIKKTGSPPTSQSLPSAPIRGRKRWKMPSAQELSITCKSRFPPLSSRQRYKNLFFPKLRQSGMPGAVTCRYARLIRFPLGMWRGYLLHFPAEFQQNFTAAGLIERSEQPGRFL
jgi:hypothetical protein